MVKVQQAAFRAPPEPFGRIGVAGNLCVARRQRWHHIASSSRLDLARKSYARDLLYFYHGLIDEDQRTTNNDSTQENENIAITGIERLLCRKSESPLTYGLSQYPGRGLNPARGLDNGRYSRVCRPEKISAIFNRTPAGN